MREQRTPIDWKNPDYAAIIRARIDNLDNLTDVDELKEYYRRDGSTIADFISDWGWVYEPRNPEIGLPAVIPFVLFPKQREWIEWVYDRWRARQPGLCEKSREVGVSWLSVAFSVALCTLFEGVSVGFTSYKDTYVDKIGEPKSLLQKARMFIARLPAPLQAGWVEWRDAPLGKIVFPHTGSAIGGEVGKEVGRGDRRSLYFVDEFAHFEHPELVNYALSQTTNCRIDMSSVKGMNNAFAQRRWGGKINVFIFDWRDDLRKDDEWYRLLSAPESEGGRGLDDVTIAQEIDRDYGASVSGIVIPSAWVRSALGARQKLGIAPCGPKQLSLDVADEGRDKNALCLSQGIDILSSQERVGKGSDIYETVEWAFEEADENEVDIVEYDADGLGAGVRGDARVVNQKRNQAGMRLVNFVGFRGSEAVIDPDGVVEGTLGREGDKGRTNKDMFANRKAQGWWELRRLFRNTHRWIANGNECSPDQIISIDPNGANAMKLVSELSQPTFGLNPAGKIVINKSPDGMPSPNLADAAMIRYSPKERGRVVVTKQDLIAAMRAPRRKLY